MPLTPKLELKETEKAYLAGLIDGEGSISLTRSYAKRTRGRYVYPLVRICNTDVRMIEWVVSRVPLGYKTYRSRLHEGCKDVIHIGWAASEAVAVLREVLPYLVIKKDRADIVLELDQINEQARVDAGGYFGNGHPLPDWLVEKRSEAIDQMLVLNARGVVPISR